MNKKHCEKQKEIHATGSRSFAQTTDILIRTLLIKLVIYKKKKKKCHSLLNYLNLFYSIVVILLRASLIQENIHQRSIQY